MGGLGLRGRRLGPGRGSPVLSPSRSPRGFGAPRRAVTSLLRPPPADLRKQARQLENELDLKLVSFSKLCTSYSGGRDGRRDRYRY